MRIALSLLCLAASTARAQDKQTEVRVERHSFTAHFGVKERVEGEGVKPIEMWVRRDGGDWVRASEAGVSVEWRPLDRTRLRLPVAITVPADGKYEFQPQIGDRYSNTGKPPESTHHSDKLVIVDTRVSATQPRWVTPRAGEDLRAGGTTSLAWSVPEKGFRANSVSIQASVDGGTPQRLAEGLPLEGTYAWTVPSGTKLRLRLAASDDSGREQEAVVEARIVTGVAIQGPEWLQPRKDDAVPADTTIALHWRAPSQGYAPDSVAIYWSLDGEGERLVAKDLPLEGRREWKTPNRAGGKLTLKLIARTTANREMGAVLKDIALLSSLEAELRWLRPDQAGAWNGADTVQLQWTNLRGNLRAGSASLAYSVDNGAWTLITKGLDPAGFYLWTVPSQATENLKLRVTAVSQAGTSVEAVSSAMTVRSAARPNISHARRHADAARIFAARGQGAQAAEQYEKALAIWPDYPEALHDLGVVYAREKQFAKALEYFLRAKKASPSSPAPYVNAASMELELGLREDALADLHDAVELGLDKDARLALLAADRLWRLADAYFHAGNEARSDEACRLLLRIGSADRTLRERAQKHLERPKKP